MYPLKLSAPTKDYIWGGDRLIKEYGFSDCGERLAEAWVLACRKNSECVIENGEFAGKPLSTALTAWGITDENRPFPLLIKLIDAHDRLSVQVHPDDAFAKKEEGEPGKTEMWYVVDCEAGARILYGFNKQTDKRELERRIKDNSLEQICNFVPVKKGDVFFIKAGTLHAIGKGIIIAEVQQNSDTTYRVSDYGRVDKNGNPRKLHIEKALRVTNLNPADTPYGGVGEITQHGFGTVRKLCACDKFNVELLNLNGNTEIFKGDAFTSLTVLEGSGMLCYQNEKLKFKKGDEIFVPLGVKADLSGKAEILIATP